MNSLKYSSEEMVSSTQLIRKSKIVFDKLQKNHIEKAIILRDGRPSFILLEFSKYEKMMKEYEDLKNKQGTKTLKGDNKNPLHKEIIIEEKKIESSEEIDEQALENALAKIDKLNLGAKEETKEKNEKPLKEFWE